MVGKSAEDAISLHDFVTSPEDDLPTLPHEHDGKAMTHPALGRRLWSLMNAAGCNVLPPSPPSQTAHFSTNWSYYRRSPGTGELVAYRSMSASGPAVGLIGAEKLQGPLQPGRALRRRDFCLCWPSP